MIFIEFLKNNENSFQITKQLIKDDFKKYLINLYIQLLRLQIFSNAIKNIS